MRFIPVIIALLLLPALALVHRYFFYQTMMAPLEAQVKSVLSGDEFAQVKMKMSYLDVLLDGEVPTLAAREQARERAASVWGVRCSVENNHLVVPAQIRAEFKGERLVFHGLLHDEEAFHQITEWLKDGRRGLEIVTDDVSFSPFATQMKQPGGRGTSPSLRALWVLVEVPPSLKIARQGGKFVLTGLLPNKELRDAVLAALQDTKLETVMDGSKLRTGTYIRTVRFTDAKALPEFVRRFFALGDTTSLEADEHGAIFSANVTDEIFADWLPFLEQLGYAETARANLRFFPSIYHLPSRKQESKLPPTSLAALESALRTSTLRFEKNDDSVTSDDAPKLSALRTAILDAGPEAHVVIGVHPGTTGDPKAVLALARKRAEDVRTQLVDRGVPSERLEIVAFSASLAPPSAASPLVGKVELFVK